MRELIGFWVAILVLVWTVAANAQQCSSACDLNGDGLTSTVQDWDAFLKSWAKKAGEAGFNVKADVDGNGFVSATDFGTFSKFCPLAK